VSEDVLSIAAQPDDAQALLLEVLELSSSRLGETYRGLLHSLHSPPFPNQHRVLAYQARELMDEAPKVMSPYGATLPAKPPTFADLKKQLAEEYENITSDLRQTPLESRSGQQKVRAFLGFIEAWLLKAEQARADAEKLARSHICGLEPGPAPPGGKALELAVRRWIALKGEFNAVLHGGAQRQVGDVRTLVSKLEGFFLHRIRPRPFENQAKIDEILQRPPDGLEASDIETVVGLIGALGVDYRYFFQQLNSPEWIGVLEERDFFKQPPGLVRVDDQIHAPDWPELAYLERVAPDALDDVGRIAREISGLHPENPRVHERLISISVLLLRVDSKHGRKLLNCELNWISGQGRLLLRIPGLLLEAALVAASKIPGLALRTVRSLLSLEVADEVEQQRSNKDCHRLGDWDLREILKRISSDLLTVLPASCQLDLLSVLFGFLRFVGENEFGDADPRAQDIGFLMWRPAIEDHEQNDLNSLSNWAIEGVRDAADSLVEEHGIRILEKLEESNSRTLLRVSLHLRSKYPDIDPDGTAKLVEDPQVLEDEVVRHELFVLLRQQFTLFPEQTQRSYLEWAARIENPHRRQLHLWPIRHALPGSIPEDYRRHEEEFGELGHPDLPVHHGVSWVGPTSPFSVSEMEEHEIPELVELLNSWQYTPGDWFAPEPEGLARKLVAFASQNAERVSAQSIALEVLQRPTYVRGIVQGLADAVKEGHAISWEPVLHFCKWAAEQERGEEPEGTGLEEFDRTWGPARKQIAWLLRRGTEESEAGIPFEFREDVWSILRTLVEDPDPTEDEEESRSEYSDPSTIAINTVRGVALGAAFSFALWVARHDPQENRTWLSFGLAEVQSALEDRLANDQSPAVRCLFGKWLPYVFSLDQEWTVSNAGRILPIDEHKEAIWIATWDAYLVFCDKLCIEFLDLLRTSYERALDRLGTERRERTRIADPDECFGHHLVLFYREGVLAPEDPLFITFFEKADTKLRYSVMADAVRLVQDIADEKRGPAISRLQDLWEWRCNTTIGERADEYHELSSFGWWFLEDGFSPEWRLRQLLETQRNSIGLELDGRVLEKMISLSEEHLPLVLDCLEAIVRNPAGGDWGMYDDHVREILRRGLDSDVQALHDQAENLVHYIGSLGFLGFRELLEA
jgi:hypothetical protein